MVFDKIGITENKIVEIFSYALQRLIKNDPLLLQVSKTKKGTKSIRCVNERAIQFRLALYLWEQLKFTEEEGLNIDVEYNRVKEPKRGYDIKSAKIKDDDKMIIPDIILHKRGKDENNIFWCEIKKINRKYTKDIEKIKSQMKKPREYQFGIYLYSLETKENNLPEPTMLLYKCNDDEPHKYKYNCKTKKLEKDTP